MHQNAVLCGNGLIVYSRHWNIHMKGRIVREVRTSSDRFSTMDFGCDIYILEKSFHCFDPGMAKYTIWHGVLLNIFGACISKIFFSQRCDQYINDILSNSFIYAKISILCINLYVYTDLEISE